VAGTARTTRARLLAGALVLASAGWVTAGSAGRGPAVASGAQFTVGAAVVSYTPPCGPQGTPSANNCTQPPAGFVDPANCLAPPLFTGRRLFAFEEPYIDQKNSGHYDEGDPFIDCNHDGRWNGNFLGGGSDAPRFYDYVADPVGARAIVVSNGQRSIAVEVLDHEGAFNIYLAAIRNQAAALLGPHASLRAGDMFISSTHDESAPDTIGLYGVDAVTSSVNPYWGAYLVQQSAKAIAQAWAARQPATIRYAEAIEPATFRQCWSSYPFVDDQLVPVLQAVNAGTGQTIATLADVSQHAETLGFNGGSSPDPDAPMSPKPTLQQEKTWVSADWPFWFRHSLETDLGGVGIEMAGSVGSNETPQVFPTAVSRTPQQFVDAGHPAGCRTTFTADQSTMVPLGYYTEDVALGSQLAASVEQALASGTVSASSDIGGSRADVCLEDTNVLFAVGGVAGLFGGRPSYVDPTCTVQQPLPPTGNTAAAFIKTEVAGFRIGDGTFVSIPGEVFPFTYLRSFLGPQDMPCPDPNTSGDCGGPASPTLACAHGNPYALPPWLLPHMHTPYRFIDGLAEDMVGYIFPCGNGIGVPGEYPVSNPSADATDRFGCGHSDDSEAASSNASDALGSAAAGVLDHLSGPGRPAAAENVVAGRYVLPDGSLSRDPLGHPESIGCSVNQTFVASGPAIAVQLSTGERIVPAQWMSLSGRAQPGGPDRNTRGWIDAAGQRHWLDVFPD
jgi:hypothetical protein